MRLVMYVFYSGNVSAGLTVISTSDDLGTVADLCSKISGFSYCMSSSVNETYTIDNTTVSAPCANQQG